ncbi:MAG: CoA-binding protein, partial [Dehalococcoidia bacterium]|nr:CoA-binding protein [Dehalococcoidia bacterium]
LYKQLDSIFYPKSVAFVGISTSNPLHWTRTFWDSLREFQFEGPLYPVNPHGGELDGYTVYTSLEEVPGQVDYVISTVNAKVAPAIVQRCARKGVKAIHFCTAGFDETGEAGSEGLQQNLAQLARETGVRIIGPNCMGIYCPESRLSYDTGFEKEAGNVGLISQSGGNSIYVAREAGWRGIRFSKVISFGNACDLNECDFLEYMIDDPKTTIIAIYLEGVKDGQRLARLLDRVSGRKPVILLKSGLGEAGARATSSHTASLAGDDAIWDALCRQFNVIRPSTAEEMVDVLVTLTYMPDPGGRNALLIGLGGGASVLLTDDFERQGFRLPPLPEQVRQELMSFSQLAGNMLRNPVDYSQDMLESSNLIRAIQVLTAWDGIDFCVGYFRPSQLPPPAWSIVMMWGETLVKAYLNSCKPVAFVCDSAVIPERHNKLFPVLQSFIKSKVPLYYTFPGIARAISMVIEYNERRRY